MNAVVTLCFGSEFEQIAKLTHPLMQRYAEKINADFVVISARKHPATSNICYEKLQMGEMLQKYERIMYFDTDVVIRKHCPNLFDVVPVGMFGAFSEGKFLDRKPALVDAIKQFGVDARLWANRYFNAGVMVFDRSHNFFIPPMVYHNNFCDQTWMNLLVFNYCHNNFMDLGPCFNRMISIDWDKRNTSYIIHYAGHAKQFLVNDIKYLQE